DEVTPEPGVHRPGGHGDVLVAQCLGPHLWGAVGQFLPPGAGASLLRSAAFFDGAGFDGAGATRPLWVLGAWALAGVLLTFVGHWGDRARASVREKSALAPVGA